MTWLWPYTTLSDARWVKGNLHLHTDESDGELSVNEAITRYAGMGYGFIAITDHDLVTDHEVAAKRHDLMVIPGYESSVHEHLLCIGSDSVCLGEHSDVVAHTVGAGGLVIVSHPNWISDEYWPVERIRQLAGVCGIEIYNTHIAHLEGSPFAVREWDELLINGVRVWGFASDDTHRRSDAGKAWISVWTAASDRRGLMEALSRGSFYASNGPVLTRIAFDASRHEVTISGTSLATFEMIGAEGARLRTCENKHSATFVLQDDQAYIRFECHTAKGTAWTQPMINTAM